MRHYAAEPEGGSRAPRAEAAKTKGLTEPAHRVLQVQRDDVSVPQRHVVHDNASRGRTMMARRAPNVRVASLLGFRTSRRKTREHFDHASHV